MFSAAPGLSHEFWIEPNEYQVETGAELVADLRVGERFEGASQVFFPDRAPRSEIRVGDEIRPYTGRMGDIPAIRLVADTPGLWVLVHETSPSTVKYKEWQKFADFAAHKDIPDIEAWHIARGLPRQDFFETYTRHVKALVGVGAAAGGDGETGMETEFIALTNPYTDDLSGGMRVRLLYQGKPRPDAQVEIFDRAPDGTVSVHLARTDTVGIASVPVAPGHDYLLDAVVLRPAPEAERAVWQSLWAGLSFAVPIR
ncbi:hypothetical protein SPO2058 [Ruegeria pomeroyi DSS-3]|uniref:Nickel uptake substrate-specific transmembrane region n=2 Tax=Ruegeria pomeroyi TaxID=89184 RepID=Q5LRR7_RUEPO|nr:hypothetical protein SPO2058 [Ruegeria pomeroyi DSS-3]